MQFIGWAFIALAVYVTAVSAYSLVTAHEPHTSPVGIAWLSVTFVVMVLLAIGKGKTGRALGSPVLRTEARVTMVDAYLAGAVLVGLVLNAAFGWWWADPLAGFVIVFYGLKEGREALSP
jgi:divalent metal cation (Fe/Co/Zn/Cd) transporter